MNEYSQDTQPEHNASSKLYTLFCITVCSLKVSSIYVPFAHWQDTSPLSVAFSLRMPLHEKTYLKISPVKHTSAGKSEVC